MRKSFQSKQHGYSLVEIVIYVAIVVVVFLAITNTVLSFSRNYRNVKVLRLVDNSGIDVMERVTRDIRGATSVDVGNSVLGTNPGVLSLTTTSGVNSTTTKFYLQNGIVQVDINGSYYGPLTLSTASTTSLIFRKMDTEVSSAVKVDLTISATLGGVTKTKSYHSTIVLR